MRVQRGCDAASEVPSHPSPCPTETFLSDFLLTHSVFMPSTQLFTALLHQYPSGPRDDVGRGWDGVWRWCGGRPQWHPVAPLTGAHLPRGAGRARRRQ